ncbi:MAG: hypothetical protein GF401_15870 [Chitinivibrionales bacterium]|nr:hypothetical protein [Chitinivibrionales bacterium]
MNDDEMILELVAESREHLSEIEPDLLELEQKGSNVSDELLNRIFRAVHSIKGGFGFYGKKTIVELSHSMENVLSRLRDRELTIDAEITDALLEGIDKLRVLLDDIDVSDEASIEKEVAALAPYLKENVKGKTSTAKESKPKAQRKTTGKKGRSASGKKTESKAEESEDPLAGVRKLHSDITEECIQEAVRNGQMLYQVTVTPSDNIINSDKSFKEVVATWENFGPVISTTPPREVLEKSSPSDDILQKDISVIIATVLEPDLIAEALGIGEEQILTLDLADYKKKYQEQRQQEREKGGTAQKDSSQKTEKAENGRKKERVTIEEAIRVKTGLLNNLMNYAGELVLARNQLLQATQQNLAKSEKAEGIIRAAVEAVKQVYEGHCKEINSELGPIPQGYLDTVANSVAGALNFAVNDVSGINGITQNINMVTSVLQENIMQTRMQPVSVVFSKFPRVIRDLARKLGKNIVLQQFGQDVELDKSIIELLSDPLTHLVRNSADHGIEAPEERERNGKPEQGTITLKAYQEGGKVFIEIVDDGGGIDVIRVKQSAIEKGLVDEEKVSELTDKEIQSFIFAPGFSSAKAVSEVSGRGVGMDVVKSNIEKLGGTIELNSEYGRGTTVTLAMPLTLAIIPSLIVSSGGRRFAIPQVALDEVVRLRAGDVTRQIERVHNAEVLRLRGMLLPLVRLSDVLGFEPTYVDPQTGERRADSRKRWSDRRGLPQEQNGSETPDERRKGAIDRRNRLANAVKIAVLRVEDNEFGLVVDNVQDSEEIVVKPLPGYLKKSACFAGATIMGDGKVAMILDPGGIAAMANLQFHEIAEEAAQRKQREKKIRQERGDEATMLLFSLGGDEHFAVDLSHIARIEKRTGKEIESVGARKFLKYDDSTLELFWLENIMPVQSSLEIGDEFFVLVPKNTQRRIGFVAARVEDTMQTRLALDKESVSGPGIKGSSLVNDTMTIVVDMPGVLDAIEQR